MKHNDIKIIIVVPTITLKEQWDSELKRLHVSSNCNVLVINTVIKNEYFCDLLIIDEIHRTGSDKFSLIFKCIQYRFILGLTATIERLDGKHETIQRYCPVVDTITLTEALVNGWVSPYTEFQVIIQVEDIDTYKRYNKEFIEHFSFFNFDWEIATNCLGRNGFIFRNKLRDKMAPPGATEKQRKELFNNITYHATQFMRCVQARKNFINNHPKKLEIARQIIAARPNSKIITFSNNIKMAESIGMNGKVYSGKDSKKKGRITMEEFAKMSTGVLHTIQKVNEGLDCPGLSVAIMIGIDSSKIKSVQRTGRVIRKEEDKKAEIFNIIIDETVELKWFQNSHENAIYTTINEKELKNVLEYKPYTEYKKSLKDFQFRY